MADLLIDWFGFSCFAYVKLTTYLLVWSNSDQSNRRSTLQWYFILFSYLPNHWLSNGAAEIPSNSLLQMHLLSQLLPMVWSPMTAKVVLSNKERDRTESKIKVKRPKSSRQWESNVGHRWRVKGHDATMTQASFICVFYLRQSRHRPLFVKKKSLSKEFAKMGRFRPRFCFYLPTQTFVQKCRLTYAGFELGSLE